MSPRSASYLLCMSAYVRASPSKPSVVTSIDSLNVCAALPFRRDSVQFPVNAYRVTGMKSDHLDALRHSTPPLGERSSQGAQECPGRVAGTWCGSGLA